MKGLIAFLLIAGLAYVAGLFYPWWTVALVAFVVELIVGQRPFVAFVIGLLSVFLLWFGLSFFIDLANDHILANRMSDLFLGNKNPMVLSVITGLVGGLVAGFAALCGAYVRNAKRKRKIKPVKYVG